MRVEVQHTGYAVTGRIKVVMDDGTEEEIGSGEMYVIRAGHDVWIVGEETFVGVDFSSEIEHFAKGVFWGIGTTRARTTNGGREETKLWQWSSNGCSKH